jgi:hypothetical protein
MTGRRGSGGAPSFAVLLSSLLQPPQAITAALSTFLPISETLFSLGSLPKQTDGRGGWS